MRCTRMSVFSKTYGLWFSGCASLIERWRLVSAFQPRQSPAPENRFLPQKAETASTVSETSSHARARWTFDWWSSVSEPEHVLLPPTPRRRYRECHQLMPCTPSHPLAFNSASRELGNGLASVSSQK